VRATLPLLLCLSYLAGCGVNAPAPAVEQALKAENELSCEADVVTKGRQFTSPEGKDVVAISAMPAGLAPWVLTADGQIWQGQSDLQTGSGTGYWIRRAVNHPKSVVSLAAESGVIWFSDQDMKKTHRHGDISGSPTQYPGDAQKIFAGPSGDIFFRGNGAYKYLYWRDNYNGPSVDWYLVGRTPGNGMIDLAVSRKIASVGGPLYWYLDDDGRLFERIGVRGNCPKGLGCDWADRTEGNPSGTLRRLAFQTRGDYPTILFATTALNEHNRGSLFIRSTGEKCKWVRVSRDLGFADVAVDGEYLWAIVKSDVSGGGEGGKIIRRIGLDALKKCIDLAAKCGG
jgi:hypothetical protein